MKNQEYKNVKEVILTGGPNGGKSSSGPHAKEVLEDRGIRVLLVPEASTILMSTGISPMTVGMIPFQDYVFELQMLQREHSLRAVDFFLSQNPEEKICIIYDRSYLDGEAYIGEVEFEKLLAKYGFNRYTAGSGTFDLAIDMVTTGYGLEHLFSNKNNKERKETVEQARQLQDGIQKSYMDFEHYVILNNSVSFEEKKRRMVNEILNLFGEPPIEKERKFLLLNDVDLSLLPKNARLVLIEQTYLESVDTERVRRRTISGIDSYYHTRKYNLPGGDLAEVQRLIEPDFYFRALDHIVPGTNPIKKDRWCFAHEHIRYELDMFKNVMWEGRPLRIVELESLNADDEVVLPEFLGEYIEVTNDKRFANFNLAKIATIE